MKRKIIFALLLLMVFAVSSSAESWPPGLRFMTGPAGGNWEILGNILADKWSAVGLPQTSNIAGGGVSNILNVHARRGDLGFSVTSLLGAALKGEADFKGRKVSNAVIMADLYTQYTYFIMRKDFAEKNNINSIEDIINNKIPVRFATLRPGTSSEFVVKALFDKAWGLDYKKIFQVQYESYESGASLLIDNHLDCFAFSVGKAAPIISTIENNIDIVLLSVSQEALDKLSEAYGTVTLEIEPGIYKSLPEDSQPVKAVGDYTCIVVRKDLPENLVYELNKTIWENKSELAEKFPDMNEFAIKTALPEKIPAHEGSVKFYDQN
ncbi:MAG: TAXI family TRAP transporter solute-binding subunit [Synergistaceae bacterium]|nr:TAXI family TRAP transporter solute-binding subunit [Synergistaceae bacterium]